MSVEFEKLEMENAEVLLYSHFFSEEESEALYKRLVNEIVWQQDTITLYGKSLNLPRLTAWYGEEGKIYSYSGISMKIHTWNGLLLGIKDSIEKESGAKFNGVLLNYYRSGNDSMGWHSDNEKELGTNPVIGSVSLGEKRRFRFRNKENKERKIEVLLTNGSFLLMKGETQHFWQHEVPKTKQAIGGRINLTFRYII